MDLLHYVGSSVILCLVLVKALSLDVEGPPHINVFKGDNAKLTCNFKLDNGEEVDTVQWYRDKHDGTASKIFKYQPVLRRAWFFNNNLTDRLINGYSAKNGEASIFIRNVTKQDESTYVCSVEKNTIQSISISLSVNAAVPAIPVTPTDNPTTTKASPAIAYFACEDPDDKPDSGDEVITFSISRNQNGQTIARLFVTPRPNDNECMNATVNDNGELSLTLHVTNSLTQMCYQQKNTDNTVNVVIIAAQNLDILRSDDYKFSFTCDFNNPTAQQIVATGGINIEGKLKPGDANQRGESVSLSLLKQHPSTSRMYIDSEGHIVLGEPIKLKLTLTKSTTASQVRGVSCVATSSSGKQMNIIRDSCSTGESQLPDGTGFGFGITDSATTFVSTTKAFPAFRFNTQNTQIHFQCLVVFCNSPSRNSRCFENNCLSLSDNGRQRRQADNSADTNITSDVAVTIRVRTKVKPTTIYYDKQLGQNACDGQLRDTTFFIIVGVLSFLLLVMIILSITLCIYLFAN